MPPRRQTITQESLLAFKPKGNVTLLHITDLHAQLVPLYYREPSVNLGVGGRRGWRRISPGGKLLVAYGLTAGSAEAHALSLRGFRRPWRAATAA